MAEEPTDADGHVASAPAPGGSAVLRDRFFIDGSRPLSHLDAPNAKAFAVEDRHDLSRNLFALICTPGIPLRSDDMRRLVGNPGTGILELVEFDTVFWQPMNQRTMVLIYVQPMGGRVVDQIKKGATRLTEYDIPRKVIQPTVDGLRHLNSLTVPHRAVRPDNFFFLDEEFEEVVLGDCLTSPEGFDQPTMFESLERAMAAPAGRGRGNAMDDLYSLGASLVVLILGHNPVEKMRGEQNLFMRMNIGSYAAICGNARIPMPLIEPLRALLSDSAEDRWGFEEVDMWLNGRKQTPLQKKAARKVETPFRFGGVDHTNIRTLAHSFNRQISEAAKILADEPFHAWLRRAADASELSDTIKGFVDTAKFHKEDFQGTEEYLVARCCAAMDPSSPIRFKGSSVCMDGFGPMMAMEMVRDGNVQVLTEIVNKQIFEFWSGNRASFIDSPDSARDFMQVKQWLGINDPGYGVERCLYELNSGLTCQSEHVIEEGVFKIDELLPALDSAAASNADGRTRPMDRHIAAFIAARFNEDINPHLRALSANRESTSIIGMLSLLAFLQWKSRAEPVYGLASWIGGLLGPAINGYHSRTTRREIEREIPKLVRRGSLPDLFDLIDNAEKRQEDQDGYAEAIEEYTACAEEIQDIEGTDSELTENAERTGQKSAAMVSVITTMIAVSIMFIAEML